MLLSHRGSTAVLSKLLVSVVLLLCGFGPEAKAQGAPCGTPFVHLTSSAQAVAAGTPVTFTATVTLSGTVTFLDNGSPIPGSSTIVNVGGGLPGVATFTSVLAIGTHNISASIVPGCDPFVSSTISILVTALPVPAPYVQQGSKLVGANSLGMAGQGKSVGISSDGNTAIIGAPYDNAGAGAAWIFIRTGNTWAQQGPKLVGSGATANASQGSSVGISGDGNTVIVGSGSFSSASLGGAWVFTRSNGVWTQQGSELVGAGTFLGEGEFGSVALSADGSAAVIGSHGRCSVFTRTGGVWTQQADLFPSGAFAAASDVTISGDGNTVAVVGSQDPRGFPTGVWVFVKANAIWSQQGSEFAGSLGVGTVALSADGNTLICGGNSALIFTRSNGSWNSHPIQLSAAGAQGPGSVPGGSVAISADGSSAIIGAFFDNGGIGAAWVFRNVGGDWAQVGNKLLASDGIEPGQGYSVALSSDGSTALVGGVSDDNSVGAAWVFVSSPPPPSPPTAPPAPTSSLTLTTNPAAPAVGQPVTIVASILTANGSSPAGGTVQFSADSKSLGTVTVAAAQASVTTTLTPGAHSVSANYSGDSIYPAASSNAQVSVYAAVPSLTLTADTSSSTLGQPVTFTAKLTTKAGAGLAAPTGRVQFFSGCLCGLFGTMIDKTLIGSAPLSNGSAVATVSTLPSGSTQVIAVYAGDSNWSGATSNALAQTVGKSATVATWVSAAVDSTQVRLAMRVSAPSSGPTPTGTVQFVDTTNNTVLATASLAAGVATASLPTKPDLTAHPLLAAYSGDANFAPGTSGLLNLIAIADVAGSDPSTVAPDEIVSIFGGKLASAMLPAADPSAPSTSLAGATVQVVDSSGASHLAPLLFVSPAQINLVIPSGMAPRTATVTVTTAAGTTFSRTVYIAATAPTLFTTNSEPGGPAAAQIVRVHADGSQDVLSAAAPIDLSSDPLYLVLYGTGIRHRSDGDAVTCMINGLSLPVVYAGMQSQANGLDQVNVLLPATLKGTGKVPIAIMIGSQVSNAPTLTFQ